MSYFVVVERREPGNPVFDLLRSLPGTSLDVFLRSPQAGEPPVLRAVCQVNGGSEGDRARVVEAMRRVGTGLAAMPAPPGSARVSAHFPVERLAASTQALVAFSARHRAPTVWTRLEEGVAYHRILVPPEEEPHALAERLRGVLEAAGVDADVAVEAASSQEVLRQVQEMVESLDRLRHPHAPG